MPRISVIVRTHNNNETLERCLLSIRQQRLANQIEILLIDDQSQKKIDAILNKFKNKNLRLFKVDFKHPIKSLNYALKLAKGKWFFILDADDTLPTQALSLLLKRGEDQKKVALVYGDYLEFKPQSRFGCYWKTSNNLFYTLAGGILINRQLVIDLGMYDEQLNFPEYDLLMKISKLKLNIQYLPQIVYHYYRHQSSLTSRQKFVMLGLKQLRKKYQQLPEIRIY